MGKSVRPDKESQITGAFSKIAKEAKRIKEREIREAKREGRFYYVDHPELMSVEDQLKYYKKKAEFESGGDSWNKVYDKNQGTMVYPYHFAKYDDK